MKFFGFETAEEALRETVCLIECSSEMRHRLWSDWSKQNTKQFWGPYGNHDKDWPGTGAGGWGVVVGRLAGMPVAVSLCFDMINGCLVCFWEPTSLVVDHRMIDKWFEENFHATYGGGRRATTNSTNFHHCIQAIEERKNEN